MLVFLAVTDIGVDRAAANVAAMCDGDCCRLDLDSVDCLKASMLRDVARFRDLSFAGLLEASWDILGVLIWKAATTVLVSLP